MANQMTTNQTTTNQLTTNQTTIQGENKNKIEIEILNSNRLIMANQMETEIITDIKSNLKEMTLPIQNTPQPTQPNYKTHLSFEEMKMLNLFDLIPYYWIKTLDESNDEQYKLVEITIVDLQSTETEFYGKAKSKVCCSPRKTLFIFEIGNYRQTKKFRMTLDYQQASPYHRLIREYAYENNPYE